MLCIIQRLVCGVVHVESVSVFVVKSCAKCRVFHVQSAVCIYKLCNLSVSVFCMFLPIKVRAALIRCWGIERDSFNQLRIALIS